jgi:hypothetical protein
LKEHNKLIGIKVQLMKMIAECGRYDEIKEVEEDLIKNETDLNTVSGLTKKETLGAIRKVNETKKAIQGEGNFSLNMVGCDKVKKDLMKIPDLMGNGNHNEPLNIANVIWERIRYWNENPLHVTLRNNKVECLIALHYLDDAGTIILENLRLHGNNIVARIVQLKALVLKEEWKDVRRLGFEAEDIIRRLFAPNERVIVAQGYRMMLNEIRNHIKNRIERTGWKDLNENGYVFEDVKPFKMNDVMVAIPLEDQSDQVMADDYEGGYDPILKHDGNLTNKERGRIFSQKIIKMKENQEVEKDKPVRRNSRKYQLRRKQRKLEDKKMEDSSDGSSYSEEDSDAYRIEEHGEAVVRILDEDSRTQLGK